MGSVNLSETSLSAPFNVSSLFKPSATSGTFPGTAFDMASLDQMDDFMAPLHPMASGMPPSVSSGDGLGDNYHVQSHSTSDGQLTQHSARDDDAMGNTIDQITQKKQTQDQQGKVLVSTNPNPDPPSKTISSSVPLSNSNFKPLSTPPTAGLSVNELSPTSTVVCSFIILTAIVFIVFRIQRRKSSTG